MASARVGAPEYQESPLYVSLIQCFLWLCILFHHFSLWCVFKSYLILNLSFRLPGSRRSCVLILTIKTGLSNLLEVFPGHLSQVPLLVGWYPILVEIKTCISSHREILTDRQPLSSAPTTGRYKVSIFLTRCFLFNSSERNAEALTTTREISTFGVTSKRSQIATVASVWNSQSFASLSSFTSIDPFHIYYLSFVLSIINFNLCNQ